MLAEVTPEEDEKPSISKRIQRKDPPALRWQRRWGAPDPDGTGFRGTAKTLTPLPCGDDEMMTGRSESRDGAEGR